MRSPFQEDVGLSVLKFCSSSNPLAHKRALIHCHRFSLSIPIKGRCILALRRQFPHILTPVPNERVLLILLLVVLPYLFCSFSERMDKRLYFIVGC